MKRFPLSILVCVVLSSRLSANLLSKIMHNVQDPSSHGKHQISRRLTQPNLTSRPIQSKNKPWYSLKVKKEGVLSEIHKFSKSQNDKKLLKKLDSQLNKDLRSNRKLLAEEKKKAKKMREKERKQSLLAKKKKEKKSRKLKINGKDRIHKNLLRKLNKLDTPAQINKLKHIYSNYGINVNKLSNADLKFLVNNSKKLLDTYYNPQAMQSKMIRYRLGSANAWR